MKPETDVIFMCGGYGKRMGDLTKNVQKCLLPFEGKPILRHSLEEATKGLGRFRPILAVSYHAEDVMRHFGRFWNGVEIEYVLDKGGVDDCGVLTTVRERLQNGPFLIVHGNIIFDGSLFLDALETHQRDNRLGTLCLAQKINESNHAVASMTDGRITDILIPPPNPLPDGYLRDMGVYAYDNSIYQTLERFRDDPANYVISLFARLIQKGEGVTGLSYSGDWLHFEKPFDLNRVKNSV